MDEFSLSSFRLRNNKPALSIIDLGYNNIVRGYSIKSITAESIDHALILRDLFKVLVGHVKICSCLRRDKYVGNWTESQFSDLAISLNNNLANRTNCRLSYHTLGVLEE